MLLVVGGAIVATALARRFASERPSHSCDERHSAKRS
jgi:hypothetical protein